jgi:putative tricarboxylic transport membrane protein
MITSDRLIGGALAVLALFVLVESRKLPLGSLRNPGPAYLPVILALLLLGVAVVLVVAGRRAPGLGALGWFEWRTAVAILAVCAFDALALERAGYRLTMTITLLFLLGLVERRGVLVTVLVAGGLAFGSFFVFETLLRVPLPRGPFGI